MAAAARALVVAGVAGGFVFWATLPDVRGLRTGWPESTAYMELRVREAEASGRNLEIRYRPVPLSRIPRHLRRAVLVAEDAGFYEHAGFDWHELREALRRAWERAEPPRGASTITQQLARNLYLSPERSALRKLREAFLTRRLERTLGKRRILELYLNVIELGEGIFGVEAASRRYFGASVSELGEMQAAMLAATIPSPLRHNPVTDTRSFRWRVRLVHERAFRDAPPSAPGSPGVAPPGDLTPPVSGEAARPSPRAGSLPTQPEMEP